MARRKADAAAEDAPLVDGPLVNLDIEPESPDDGRASEPIGDAFIIDPLRLARLKEKGIDTRITRCRVSKLWNGKRYRKFDRRGSSEWTPNVVTPKWLKDNWGGGDYDLSAFNDAGQYIAATRLSVDGEEQLAGDAAGAGSSLPGGAVGGNGSLSDRLLERFLLRALEGPPAAPPTVDPMRETMAAIARMSAETTNAVNRLLLARAEEKPKNNELEMFDRIAGLLERTRPATPAKKDMGLSEFLPVLQFARALVHETTRGNGTSDGESQLPAWLEIVPDVADKIGVPLIVTIAQAVLPEEKAQQAIKAIEEHMRTRQAEAEASVVDTTGETGAP
ncbi:MAG TPA: hypothetical protein VN896_01920 [Methylomirabilota bacterium]|nr:hypothetical protein [Methylomirabilota bacterium]